MNLDSRIVTAYLHYYLAAGIVCAKKGTAPRVVSARGGFQVPRTDGGWLFLQDFPKRAGIVECAMLPGQVGPQPTARGSPLKDR